MLSYRHAFHAGNYADVLKHLVQVEILRYLQQKDKPLVYIDTHAGAGLYALDSAAAEKPPNTVMASVVYRVVTGRPCSPICR